MKKKFKLFATIGSLALAVCMMTIGVLAANSVSLTVNSTVSFSATGVYADVTGTIAGAATGNTSFAASNYTSLTGSSDGTFTNVTEGSLPSGTWTVNNVTFGESNTEITYTFVFTNKTPDKNLQIVVTDNTTADSTVTVDKNGDTSTLTAEGVDGTATYTLTLTLTDVSQSADATVNISFALTAVDAA